MLLVAVAVEEVVVAGKEEEAAAADTRSGAGRLVVVGLGTFALVAGAFFAGLVGLRRAERPSIQIKNTCRS